MTNEKDEKRLRELLIEINVILSSENPRSSVGIIGDINRELRDIVNRK